MSSPDTTLSGRLLGRLAADAPSLLTRPVKRFYLGTILGALATGLILSLFVVYFVQVRHFPVTTATRLLAYESVLGLAISPLYGTLVDRFGPSRILAVGMPILALGVMAIGFASTPLLAFAVATVLALGGAGVWGAVTVLLTRLVPDEERQHAFGINFMLLNLGIGLGGLVGTSIARVNDLQSFQVLYIASGAITLVQAAVFFTLRSYGGPPEVREHHERERGGWGVVLRDRKLLRYLAASVLLVICGYGSVEAGLPFFVTKVAKLPLYTVGLLFFFNTFTIVVSQVFVLARIKGKSRSILIGLVGLLWGGSWFLATSSLVLGTVLAILVLCTGQIVFALGETMWAPTAPALVNDLAAEHLRGRYNALSGLIWGISGSVGPLIAGLFLQSQDTRGGAAWTICIGVGAIVGGIFATSLRGVLTPQEDGRAMAESTAG